MPNPTAGIFWVASPSSGVVSYKVYRGTASGGPYALVGSGVTSTTFKRHSRPKRSDLLLCRDGGGLQQRRERLFKRGLRYCPFPLITGACCDFAVRGV